MGLAVRLMLVAALVVSAQAFARIQKPVIVVEEDVRMMPAPFKLRMLRDAWRLIGARNDDMAIPEKKFDLDNEYDLNNAYDFIKEYGLKNTMESSPKRKRRGSCIFHAGLGHNCDYKDLVASVNEIDHWGSALAPGKKR